MAGLLIRDNNNDLPPGWVIDKDGIARPFWYSSTGYLIKWILFAVFFGLTSLYLIIGRIHAYARIKKGLLPLSYHRWMVNREVLAKVDPRYAAPMPSIQPYTQPPPAYYNMQPMAPPPTYQPSPGFAPAGKAEYSGNYAPPAGAPPPPMQASQTAGVTGGDQFAPPSGPPPPRS